MCIYFLVTLQIIYQRYLYADWRDLLFYFYIVLIIIDRLLYICLSVKYDEKYDRNNDIISK